MSNSPQDHQPVTATDALFTFYDVECLQNVFTLAAYVPRTEQLDVFYLIDQDGSALGEQIATDGLEEKTAQARILAANPAYRGDTVNFHDLSLWRSNLTLAKLVGLSDADPVNDPRAASSYGSELRPVCDTDDTYDPFHHHSYLAGYNSAQYDTTILALYLMSAFSHLPAALINGRDHDHGFVAPSARELRGHNDKMFASYREYMPRYLTEGKVANGQGWQSVPQLIRASMVSSGRHLDVARLNELQRFVGLKRLLGGLGRQIMESDQLGAHNAVVSSAEALHDLMAYNVSDVVGLHKLFEHPTYSNAFDLKKGLLEEYPETIHEKRADSYAPDTRGFRTRRNRLGPDSTSAKFVSLILAPYAPLKDMPVVSFDYPSAEVAAKRGIERVNVLAQCREFFHACVTDEDARAAFQRVHDYYASIEGKNFNGSDNYQRDFPMLGAPGQPQHPVHILRDIPKAPNNLPYFHADGSPSNCFATFSTGGIHGAEADSAVFAADMTAWQIAESVLAQAKATHPDPLTLRTAKSFITSDGREIQWNEVLTAKSVIASRSGAMDLTQLSEALASLGPDPDPEQVADVERAFAGVGYRAPKPRPQLFVAKDDGSTRLKPKYAHTSAGPAIHEDFSSYYPNLLRNMSAFDNPELGMDRYEKIFFDKERYGALMKAPDITAVELERLKVLREGTKLILNTASGAGDTTFGNSPIRMNNTIIAMRIIGQLFSWRIGQAQTTAGAKIVSTNTDGLYSVLDRATNDRVLAEQTAAIGIDIEPEELLVVSKDSNNRLELLPPKNPAAAAWDASIMSASGASLACYAGPQPTKSLAHPAVLDWALARYLRCIVGGYTPPWRTAPLALNEPMDISMARQLIHDAIANNPPLLALRLFQNVLAASPGNITYPFASDLLDPTDPERITNHRSLQHFNRVFVVHPTVVGAVSLRSASSHVVNAASRLRRKADLSLATTTTDNIAKKILADNGFARDARTAANESKQLLPEDQDVGVRKIPGLDPGWPMLIDNRDLVELPETELSSLLESLDLDIYTGMLAESFDKNWKSADLSGSERHEEKDQ